MKVILFLIERIHWLFIGLGFYEATKYLMQDPTDIVSGQVYFNVALLFYLVARVEKLEKINKDKNGKNRTP